MHARTPLRIALLLAAATQLSCAATGLKPMTHSQPAERIGLAPEFHVFYDALQGTGDWVYIQPFGYVFRPDVNFITWRPYEDGFWAPSEIYGWTWISAESFGWATYHYGRWLYDRYYGWVWTPGLDWGPAWVAWELTGDYAGWSPLLTPGTGDDQIRGGPWTFAPIAALGATDLKGRVVHASDIPVRDVESVRNFAERSGVRFNRGPSFDLVERRAGTLGRVKLEDAGTFGVRVAGTGKSASTKEAEKSAAAASDAARRAAEQAALDAQRMVEQGAALPASLPVVRAQVAPRSTGKTGAKTQQLPPAPVGTFAPQDTAR